MPDHPLADGEIDAVLAYIRAGAPGVRRSGEVREAGTATPAEVDRGRDLFTGRAAFARGGAACGHCHTAGRERPLAGGSLASDLSGVYRRYQDWGLHQALRRSDFPLMRGLYARRPLTEEEVFAIKAYLHRAPGESPRAAPYPALPMAFLGLGSSALVLLKPRRRPRWGARDRRP